jgi:transcriptional regulator with XRE-family HTH domain
MADLTYEVMAPLHTGSYAALMTVHQLPFGVLLRRWRERRRMTQADLALAAKSSTRHLSCLETGRSQPSREMIARLAEYLDIPLRDQNSLLLAAGFAPAFKERSLAALEAAKSAIDRVLQAHKPYPAFAVDRHWNVVLSNSALPQLYEGCSADLLRPPVNAVRLILHPAGMGPRIVNFTAWRAHTLSVLRQQIETRADPVSQGLLAEVAGQYGNVRKSGGFAASGYASSDSHASGHRVLPEYRDRIRHSQRCDAGGARIGDAIPGG